MHLVRTFILAPVAVLCFCGTAHAQKALQADVDLSFEAVKDAVGGMGLTAVLDIDHARLAAAEGVEMPPSRVQLFSDARINTTILKQQIRAGVDLPFRILSYGDMG